MTIEDQQSAGPAAAPVYLVGAFERHNFGDWLLAFVADHLLGRASDVQWINVLGRMGVGMSEDCGNFSSIWDLVGAVGPAPPVIHVGGETLACRLLPAVQMSLAPHAADSVDPRSIVPLGRSLAYVTPETEVILGKEVQWGPRVFFGVGGRTTDLLPDQLQNELARQLRRARWVSVRDTLTQRRLSSLGVDAQLHPDLATLLPALRPDAGTSDGGVLLQISQAVLGSFGPEMVRELAPLSKRFPQLTIGIAGIAPHHDRLRDALDLVALFDEVTPNGWARAELEIHPLAIAGRIRSSALVIASSLHYRILAMSYGIPGVSIGVEKAIAYAQDWDIASFGAMEISELLWQVDSALEPSQTERLLHAKRLQDVVMLNWRAAMETIHE